MGRFANASSKAYSKRQPGHHLCCIGGGIEMQNHAYASRQFALSLAPFLAAIILTIGTLFGVSSAANAQQTTASSEKIWEDLKGDVFGDRAILVDTGVVRIEAPKRAQDAAIVPVDIYVDPAKAPDGIKSVTLIIDANPAPVAATFQIGKDAGVTHLSTRVRVNDYSYLRAIAETQGGQLHMAQTFVKASGGCSAPAVKNQDEAMATMGQMKLRQFPPQETMSKAEELQLMIRHPNNSGLQRDPLTQYFIPAHFVQKLSISQAGRPILSMEGGISISEDPNFRFDFTAHGNGEIQVEAIDTDGKVFRNQWPLEKTGL
ncbi:MULTISPECIES: quinoprotein dehydrogenase-associated SoxYZ-like carrier [unclassified Mesorhizobium]|uniref:quinoprotein dehydrogenase-associated SoxYZ-like carrier n=1 Tax=unclassified Mesorhizobium TaxID=325217 RepID=UPI001CCEFFD2|nr:MULTISPECIES: quinoprotein dehydrogenase-associated SoxYZ-like carrier [unclassified Mesorhizobium]MBZ9896218.1 quinoprotein dehydrogenase-associated SoxYZ-like carrier [Mesorhizobium sp. BR1-1-6]MCA0002262.1 quinoprotein dehydrogenase-associated SoxYZ-like carrier [Mesorhizobium sp. B264B2A]MCA0008963.1 quinoprotein dehydrogenase-associated SoxYZ-like carrier [Mesorhizobium sp. B264B1B]MCA0017040.1 quinoprotein dehydrogenase-associated SoxYZ-like carrier [Mesorhizobium sp. B264B1A]